MKQVILSWTAVLGMLFVAVLCVPCRAQGIVDVPFSPHAAGQQPTLDAEVIVQWKTRGVDVMPSTLNSSHRPSEADIAAPTESDGLYDVKQGELTLPHQNAKGSPALWRDRVAQAGSWVGVTDLNIHVDDQHIDSAKSVLEKLGSRTKANKHEWNNATAQLRKSQDDLKRDTINHARAYASCQEGLAKARKKRKIEEKDPIGCWMDPLDGAPVTTTIADNDISAPPK